MNRIANRTTLTFNFDNIQIEKLHQKENKILQGKLMHVYPVLQTSLSNNTKNVALWQKNGFQQISCHDNQIMTKEDRQQQKSGKKQNKYWCFFFDE